MADNGSGLSSLSGLYARDPAAAIRQRQLLRAQQMQQEGSNTAPVAHWSGGLNRIMQAVMGRLDESRLMGEQRAETEGRQEELGNFSRGLAMHMTPQGAPQAQQQPPAQAAAPVAREPQQAPAGALPAGYRLGGQFAGAPDASAPGYDPAAESDRRTRLSGQPVNNPANAEWAAGLSPPVGRINAAWNPNQGQPGNDRIGAALLGQQPAPQPNAAPTPTAAPAQPGAGPTGMNAILAMAMKGQGSDNPMVREAAGRAMQTAALMGTQADRRDDNTHRDRVFAFQQGQAADQGRREEERLAIARAGSPESFGAPMEMMGPNGPVMVRPGSRGGMTPVQGYSPAPSQVTTGLNPIIGQGPNGEPVIMLPTNRGGLVQPQLPAGVTAQVPRSREVNVGTEIHTLDQAGNILARRPIDIVGRESAERRGAVLGAQQAAAPASLRSAEQSITLLDAAINHPGLRMATGMTSFTGAIAGTDMADFRARISQIEGRTFLEAFEALKGGGAVTEAEGRKATESMARLGRATSAADYRTALGELRETLSQGRDRARALMPQPPQPGGAAIGQTGMTAEPPARTPGVQRYNPATGRLE